MSQDPSKDAPTPEDLLAQTRDLLGESPDHSAVEQSGARPPAGPVEAGSPAGAPVTGVPVTGAPDPAGRTPTIPATGKRDRPVPSTSAGMSAGMWISLILGAIILVLLLIFIVQNNVPADFRYFGWTFRLPLGVAMLFSALGGILVAGIIGSARIFILGRRLKKIERAFKK